tara:strand:- start:5373 stop:6557 length:1185 start_codon:yes stop_codon:yes gene_type:complete
MRSVRDTREGLLLTFEVSEVRRINGTPVVEELPLKPFSSFAWLQQLAEIARGPEDIDSALLPETDNGQDEDDELTEIRSHVVETIDPDRTEEALRERHEKWEADRIAWMQERDERQAKLLQQRLADEAENERKQDLIRAELRRQKAAEKKRLAKKKIASKHKVKRRPAAKYRGVCKTRMRNGKRAFQARLGRKYIGTYSDPKTAALAHDTAARAAGLIDNLNFPDEQMEIAATTRSKKSRFFGVSYCKLGKLWIAYRDGKIFARFKTEIEAALAYDEAVLSDGGWRINHASVDDEKERQDLLKRDKERLRREKEEAKNKRKAMEAMWYERNSRLAKPFRGVKAHKTTNRFQATFCGNYLGIFPTPEEAARAHDAAAREAGFAKLNFPDEMPPKT